MNAYIPKVINYLSANRFMAFVLIVLINTLAIWVKNSSEITIHGRVEAQGYRLVTHSTLYKTTFRTRSVRSTIDGHSTNAISHVNTYEHSKAHENTLISLGESGSIAISYNRMFSLDDDCSLFFNGQEKLTLTNVSLRCFN